MVSAVLCRHTGTSWTASNLLNRPPYSLSVNPLQRSLQGLVFACFAASFFVVSFASTKNSPICRRKFGKSTVTVRNLPNDFGKKGDRIPESGAGA